MSEFTPQQAAGAGRFSSKVRVGNWREDVVMEEALLKDYLRKKARGELMVDKVRARKRQSLQAVPHSYSADGRVRFGDSIQLASVENGNVLACNIWERVAGADEAYAVTAGSETAAVARNTFVVAVAAEEDDGKWPEEGVLHYGQPFRLESNPSLRVDPRTGMRMTPLYLASDIVTAGRFAKLSHHQEVYMALRRGYDSVWKVESAAAGAARFGKLGRAVDWSEPIVLRHCKTNQALFCSARAVVRNEFGAELEVAAHTEVGTGKVERIVAERGGAVPLARMEAKVNRWRIVMADDAAAAVDERDFVDMTPEAVLAKVRETVKARGSHGIRGIGRAFRIMDDAGDGKLDKTDFVYGLKDAGIHLTDEEFVELLPLFDRDGDGLISFDEFLRALRGPMSERRIAVVREAFRRLDKTGDGIVTVEDLEMAYDTSFHPEVIDGKMTPREALAVFLQQWDRLEADGIVSFDEFLDYYKDVSASMDTDDGFVFMMVNAWHISGDEFGVENTSCRRVLVTHPDGSQTVEEITDDLGIGPDDIDAMKENLAARGIVAVSISLAD